MQSNISIIEDIVRSYPVLLEKRRVLQHDMAERCRRDPTAAAATATLPEEDQRRLEALTFAIRHTRRGYDNGELRMFLINATYWDYTFHPALEKISAATAQEWKNDFLEVVSQQLNLSSCEGCIYWKPLFPGSIKACLYCYKTGRLRVYDSDECYSKQASVILTEEENQLEAGETA